MRNLGYTFPKPISNERYVFRSYLKSTRILNDKGQVSNGYIKYSAPYYFYDIGFIDEFSQESVSENEEEYIFECKAHASINSLENVSSWGIYYDNGDLFPQKFSPKEYSEPSITSQSSAEFEIELRIKKSDFVNDTYKDIKLGIYSYSVNDNNTKWGTTQTFTLNTDDRWVDLGLPSGILWAKYNVGATSPEEYGGYYAWGETEEKSSYTYETYHHKSNGGYKLINNISGTQYDVASKEWGDGARIPTYSELAELQAKCTWKIDTYNNIKGVTGIGLNGNTIFIPFAGGMVETYLSAAGVLGCIWSDCLESVEDPDDAYYLIFSLCDTHGLDIDISADDEREYGMTIRPVKNKI